MSLTTSRLGRIWLHVLCVVGDREWAWHLNGIVRELVAQQGKRVTK